MIGAIDGLSFAANEFATSFALVTYPQSDWAALLTDLPARWALGTEMHIIWGGDYRRGNRLCGRGPRQSPSHPHSSGCDRDGRHDPQRAGLDGLVHCTAFHCDDRGTTGFARAYAGHGGPREPFVFSTPGLFDDG